MRHNKSQAQRHQNSFSRKLTEWTLNIIQNVSKLYESKRPKIPIPTLKRHFSSTLDLSGASYDYRRDTLYATKSIAVILSDTLVTMASQVLVAMQKYINKSDFDVQVLTQ